MPSDQPAIQSFDAESQERLWYETPADRVRARELLARTDSEAPARIALTEQEERDQWANVMKMVREEMRESDVRQMDFEYYCQELQEQKQRELRAREMGPGGRRSLEKEHFVDWSPRGREYVD